MERLLELEGTRLGRYRLRRCLGQGGMAEVYLARDEQMRRDVAIKVVAEGQSDLLLRFQREVESIGSLIHEHILPVFDYGEEGKCRYLVMQYVAGGTLRERLDAGPLSPEEIGSILVQVASALQYAHERGIVHRDIKPSNILLRGPSTSVSLYTPYVYLADFGLARPIEGGGDLTRTGCLMGTPEYMAPELANEFPRPSVDIYALGVLLYQMLTGQVPFTGSSVLAVYWKHMQEQPVPPSVLKPSIPRSVEQVVLRALEKEPRKRFQTPLELALAYQGALNCAWQSQTLDNFDTPAPTVSTSPLRVQWVPQHLPSRLWSKPALLLALVFLFVTSIALAMFLFNGTAPTQPATVSGATVQTHDRLSPTSEAHRPRTPTPHATPTRIPVVFKPTPTPSPTPRPSPPPSPTPGKHGHKHRHR